MKILLYKSTLFLFLGLIGYSPLMAENTAAKKEFTKSIKKEYDISSQGTIDMTNRHGKVDIKTWDQNRVKVEVLITVNAGNEEKANDIFDRINIEFSNSSNVVKAETIIESAKKSWMSSWWSSDSNSKYTIDYEVYMPASCQLKLTNKYGNSSVEKIKGEVSVIAKYGNVQIDGVDNNLSLIIGYGNATIESAKDVEVIIKYGNLRMEDVRDVDLESKYSKVSITKAADLDCISKYDTYRLGKIRNLHNQGKYDDFEIEWANDVDATSRYSDFEINHLAQRGHFHLEYGSLKIETLSNKFSKLEADTKYTNISVGVEAGGAYELDISTHYADIHYPSDADIHYEIDRSSSHEVKGFVGGNTAKSRIHIRANYGHVKVR